MPTLDSSHGKTFSHYRILERLGGGGMGGYSLGLRCADKDAYDFTRDLSTVVYARPGGHAKLYYLGDK